MGYPAEKRDNNYSRGREISQPSTGRNRLQPLGGGMYVPDQDRIRELLQHAADNPPPESNLSPKRRPVTTDRGHGFIDVEYFVQGQPSRIIKQAKGEDGKPLDE